MDEREIDAEMIALEQEISRLQSSINKSQLRTDARDSGVPESRQTTMAEQDNMGQGARPKLTRTATLPNTSIRPDNLTEFGRTTDKEQGRFSLTSTPYHANIPNYDFPLRNSTNITIRRPENFARADKRKVDIVKPDKFDGRTS